MANEFKIDEAHLARIIDANDLALTRARDARAGVESDSELVRSALMSQSGGRLGGGLVDWSSDFNAVINALEQLQAKAQAYRSRTASIDADASSAAAMPVAGYNL